jgi:hypothetical protein
MFCIAAVVGSLLSSEAFTSKRVWLHDSRTQKCSLQMSECQSQVLAAQPTIEEWLDVAEPGLKKATLAMFRSVKEIAYKIRTASCDKMSCFNDFGKSYLQLKTSVRTSSKSQLSSKLLQVMNN